MAATERWLRNLAADTDGHHGVHGVRGLEEPLPAADLKL
jgi:hypothetical protein